MVITEYEHWLVVRQSRRRRIYRVTLVATVSRTLRTPLGARRTRRVVSCNYGGFISGACVSPRGVYAARVARQRGMGIPGDHVNRVETYQCPVWTLDLATRWVLLSPLSSLSCGFLRDSYVAAQSDAFRLISPSPAEKRKIT